MMSGWTEYRAGDEWPEGEQVKWEVNLQGEWFPTANPKNSWASGYRVRYRERESEMLKIAICQTGTYVLHETLEMPEWVRLAAPIAAYYKSMRYIACDADGQVSGCSGKHEIGSEGEWWIRNGEAEFICYIPKKAMPADWKTAIVELVFEGAEE
jgi:hypothetical protein